MKEILPGVLHWTRLHPKIKFEVSSYYLLEEGVLIDPMLPEAGVDALPSSPRHILLTNRHHYRDSAAFAEACGCDVHCVESGLHEFKSGEQVESFQFGDTLPGGIRALEIGGICPDETALLIPRAGALALADGAVRYGDGPLGFVPDAYMGEDPERVKANLKRAYRRVLEHEFDHLLTAHGPPWIGGGQTALRALIEA
jgi:hypothetical protein